MRGWLLTGWLDVRNTPLRTIAAIAGMIAAVLAVVVVDAAGILSNNANEEYLVATYGQPATMSLGANTSQELDPTILKTEMEQFQAYLQRNGVTRISPTVDLSLQIVAAGTLKPVQSMWVNPEFANIGVFSLIAGSFPNVTADAPVLHIVVTSDFLTQIGLDPYSAVGTTLQFVKPGPRLIDLQTERLYTMVIDGVVESFGPNFDSFQMVVVSRTFPPQLGEIMHASWVVQVNPADEEFVSQLVAAARPFPMSMSPAFSVFRMDQGESLQPVLDQQEVTARAVQAVALVIGGLGILGVGLAGVRERSQEFGLRRALGASKKRVFADVLLQTLIEVGLAAAIAIPAAAIAVDVFARQLVLESLPLPRSTALPLQSAALGLFAALAVGLLAGLLPAMRAARASVVESLRG